VSGGRRHGSVAPSVFGTAVVGAVSGIHRPRADRALARPGAWRARDGPPAGPGAVDDLAGVAPQRRHAFRRPRVPRDDGAMACGSRRAPAEAGEAGAERPAAAILSTGTQISPSAVIEKSSPP